ncbi:MAG: hypothetical protein JXA37_07680 [Chloroflexia bacterium]|nr:hypothetical protein [Chloroflexia bacterium]
MNLWIETAWQELLPIEKVAVHNIVRTFQTETLFWAFLVSALSSGDAAGRVAAQVEQRLTQGQSLDAVLPAVLGSLRPGEYVPLAMLQVVGGRQVQLVEVDAPPLFMVRRGRLILLPVIEEEVQGRLVRRCDFALQQGDHLAMVNTEYIRAKGWDRRWGWRDIALSIKRLTDTGCDAWQLLGALLRMYERLSQDEGQAHITVVAMHVRPLRTLTLWSGPPADLARDQEAVDSLLAETGTRVICGGTTAEIAARLLGRPLEIEARPAGGWDDVPPTSRLEGVDLVTEGVVTLRRTRRLLAGARRARDLPRSNDGATRLARLLLAADVVRFVIGLAVNPAQMDGQVSWRQQVLEGLVTELRTGGKIVSVEYIG